MLGQNNETDEFYIQPLEKWRISMGLDKMNLIGHSFGGYICSRYAVKYPDNINKLILWSPLGCESKPENYEELYKERIKKSKCRFRLFLCWIRCVFRNECRPFKLMRCIGK